MVSHCQVCYLKASETHCHWQSLMTSQEVCQGPDGVTLSGVLSEGFGDTLSLAVSGNLSGKVFQGPDGVTLPGVLSQGFGDALSLAVSDNPLIMLMMLPLCYCCLEVLMMPHCH